jgi:molybdopterin oxidoreductase, iron-sulfur binding subunit
MSRYGIIVNVDRCAGCFACAVACKEENQVAPGIFWEKIKRDENVRDNVINWFRMSCMHCDDPACMKVCPMKAIHKGPHGEVLVDQQKCIGCKMCMAACPYGARSYNPEAKVVEKCTLCHHLQEVGDQPACVKVCCAKARFFGDVDDPESDVSKVLAAAGTENVHSMPDSGNHPTVRYILHKKTGEWQVNPPKMVEN